MNMPKHLSHSNTANSLVDSLSVMIEQESSKHYSCSDYLSNKSLHSRRRTKSTDCYGYEITSEDRMDLVDWCYQIVDNCKFDRETVAIAMNIADRYMCTPQAHHILYHRGNYQLVILTALYISIKIHEPLAFGSQDFASLSKGTYSTQDIEDMELQMLEGLKWRLSCPSSLQLAHTILSLMASNVQGHEQIPALAKGVWAAIFEEVAFQTENAVRVYDFTTLRSSTVAVAAVLNAIEQINDRDYPALIVALTSILREFEFDSPHQIKKVMDKLSILVNEDSEEDAQQEQDPENSGVRRESLNEDEIASVSTSRTDKYSHAVSFTDVCDNIYD